jgi:hypothetical protein
MPIAINVLYDDDDGDVADRNAGVGALSGDNAQRLIPKGGPPSDDVWAALNPNLSRDIVFPLAAQRESHKARLRELATKYFGKVRDARRLVLSFYCFDCDINLKLA